MLIIQTLTHDHAVYIYNKKNSCTQFTIVNKCLSHSYTCISLFPGSKYTCIMFSSYWCEMVFSDNYDLVKVI